MRARVGGNVYEMPSAGRSTLPNLMIVYLVPGVSTGMESLRYGEESGWRQGHGCGWGRASVRTRLRGEESGASGAGLEGDDRCPRSRRRASRWPCSCR